jgi:hypothetical protein
MHFPHQHLPASSDEKNFFFCLGSSTQVDGSAQQILPELRGNEIYSGYFLPFPVRIRTEPARNIDGSSIPAGIYPYRNRRHPTDSSYGKKRNAAVSARINTKSS